MNSAIPMKEPLQEPDQSKVQELRLGRDFQGVFDPPPPTKHIKGPPMSGGRLRQFKGHGKGHYLTNKTTVFGMVERGGIIRTGVVPNERRETLLPIIQAHVAAGSTISTDSAKSYRTLAKHGYEHGAVNHMIKQWKSGVHHTNSIEGFWSHLKRGLVSTHVSVSQQHLPKYIGEFSFRYNNRDDPAAMFDRLVRLVSQALGQQRDLGSILAFDESLHVVARSDVATI